MAEQIRSEAFGCYFDLANPVRRRRDTATESHLKDVGAGGAETDTPEFGTGVFPHGIYLEFLKTRRPDLPIIFEHIPDAMRRVHALMSKA